MFRSVSDVISYLVRVFIHRFCSVMKNRYGTTYIFELYFFRYEPANNSILSDRKHEQNLKQVVIILVVNAENAIVQGADPH